MDAKTKELIEQFVAHFEQEINSRKTYKSLKIINWSLNGIKLSIKCLLNENHHEIFVDLRELKDNVSRFSHLTDNLFYQIDVIKNNQEAH